MSTSIWSPRAFLAVLVLSRSVAVVPASAAPSPLPSVNLGYVTQGASEYRAGYDLYKFNNIRYAASTGGLKRFSSPAAPSGSSSSFSNGTLGYTCPQAYSNPNLPWPENEDCLFLDVQVPRAVFDGKTNAPVAVWIHGGGFETGYKTSTGDPAGLVSRSREFGDKKGAVYVAINYRLGAYGWIGGPNWQRDAPANLGLLDQAFALQWVQKYIRLFGGDPSRVTIMGESAGGASVMHHLIAFGGANGPPPFKRAVIQSPGFAPRPDPAVNNERYRRFLQLAGAANIADLKNLQPSSFYARNQQFQQAQPEGTFAFVPVPDGGRVPAPPAQLLTQGRFYHGVDLLVSRVNDEALTFTPKNQTISSAFAPWLKNAFWPTIPQASLDFLTNTLYPADYSGRQGYTTPFDRLKTAIADAIFNCNTLLLNRAVGNTDHEYVFHVGRAQHGDDVGYTFYTENERNPSAGTPGGLVNADRATQMQRYIMSFVVDGKVQSTFPQYGAEQKVLDVGNSGVTTVLDNVRKARCNWWQQGRLGP